jgi:hypothetical protein
MSTEYQTTFYGASPRSGWSFLLSGTLLINLLVYVTARAILDPSTSGEWLINYAGLIVFCLPTLWCCWLLWKGRRRMEWTAMVLSLVLATVWLSQAGELYLRVVGP